MWMSQKIKTPCVIFAGGKSSRMGEDKALLPFGTSATLTQHLLEKMEDIFECVYISTKDRKKFNFEAKFILDKSDVFAPTSGFVESFKILKCDFFAISVDSPFVSKKIIEKIILSDHKDLDAVVAKADNKIHPMIALYKISLQHEFEKMLKDDNHKLGFLLKNSKTKYIEFQNNNEFLNLNNQDDYRLALSLL